MTARSLRVAVTGATGYLGGRLVEHLDDAGEEVVAIAAHRPAWSTPVPVEVRDLGQPDAGARASLAGVDAIVHLAGANEVLTRQDPVAAVRNTVAAARTIVADAVALGVPRIVYVSTVHVYGSPLAPGAVVDETHPVHPVGAYAEARLTVEQVLTGQSDVEVVVFRLTNAIGPPVDPGVDRWSLVAADLCRQAVTEGRLRLLTPGTQWRDFVALADVLPILAQACTPAMPPDVYNLGSGRPSTILHLAELVQREATAAGAPVQLVAPPPDGSPGPPPRIDVSRLASVGLTARTDLSTMVAELLAYCRHRRDALVLPS